jgi:hypothetical protein
MSMRPASIFEKSRMSLMMVSSASPLSRMVPRSRAARRERRVQQQAAHADHRVHRRADLVAHGRQEGALGLVGGFLGGEQLPRVVLCTLITPMAWPRTLMGTPR